MRTDCHFHTNLSDWRFDNNQVIAQAKEKKIVFAVCTDHDVINHDFPELARKNWIWSTEWVEVSCFDEANNSHLHFTTYAKKFQDRVADVLENTRNGRREKIIKQIHLLQKNWFKINENKFYEFFTWKTNTDNLNISHITSYVYLFVENIDLIKKLTWEKLEKEQFLLRCLKNEWDLKHIWAVDIGRYEPTIEEFWEIAKKDNYVFSLAHPNFKMTQEGFKQRIWHYVKFWVNAVEVNVQASQDRVELLLEFQKKLGYILTFWSDSHFKANEWRKHWAFWDVNPFISQDLLELNMARLREKLEI